jgi:hybrid cluster-associated redox disulfide protein
VQERYHSQTITPKAAMVMAKIWGDRPWVVASWMAMGVTMAAAAELETTWVMMVHDQNHGHRGEALVESSQARQQGLESEVEMSEIRLEQEIGADCLVQEIVEDYPQTVFIFAHHGLQCAGCYISAFHTIADSAQAYAIPLEPLLRDLNRAVVAGRP